MPGSRTSGSCTEQFVEVEGVRVRYLHCGAGPALVLIHGLMGYSFSWRFAIPILAEQYEVFALDMPGSGFSDCTLSMEGTLVSAAGRLARILDALGIKRYVLVGSSYGGTTALRLATMEPDRVCGVVLVAPANPWSRIGRKRLAALGFPGIGYLFPKLSRRLRVLHKYFVRRMYGDPSRITRETLQGYSLPLVRPGVFEHALKITRSWHQDMSELQAALPKAAGIPALLVWGSKDRLVAHGSADLLGRNFRVADTIMIPGAGHLPYEEVPEAFCRPVLEFLKAHFPANASDGK